MFLSTRDGGRGEFVRVGGEFRGAFRAVQRGNEHKTVWKRTIPAEASGGRVQVESRPRRRETLALSSTRIAGVSSGWRRPVYV
eukprot:4470659-Prymnesium_polylepis.1